MITKPVAPSWIKRDWISRKAEIIVTNNKDLLHEKHYSVLRKSGKKILSVLEFILFIIESFPNNEGGNKRNLLNNKNYNKDHIFVFNCSRFESLNHQHFEGFKLVTISLLKGKILRFIPHSRGSLTPVTSHKQHSNGKEEGGKNGN